MEVIELIEDFGNTNSDRYKYGHAATIGRRKEMQDSAIFLGNFNNQKDTDLFCLFDGHGTAESANFAAKELPSILSSYLAKFPNDIPLSLRKTFIAADKQLSFAINHGTTAVVALIVGDYLYVANVGDSRAVLCRNGKAVWLTVDHKTSLEGETERIVEVGGFVVHNRVNGSLAVTRALGDHFAGKAVSPEPYLTVTKLCSSDEFLLLACDGLFDVISNEAAIEMARLFPNPNEASERLKSHAFAMGSTDNISVAIINFGKNHQSNQVVEDPQVVYGLHQSNNIIIENSKLN